MCIELIYAYQQGSEEHYFLHILARFTVGCLKEYAPLLWHYFSVDDLECVINTTIHKAGLKLSPDLKNLPRNSLSNYMIIMETGSNKQEIMTTSGQEERNHILSCDL